MSEPTHTAPDPPGTDSGAERLRVRGTVQGVGFRPAVYQLATALGLGGEIGNDAEGVFITLEGPAALRHTFVERLREQAPPLSRIAAIERRAERRRGRRGFRISASRGTRARTGVAADVAACPACVAEALSPADRRSGYGFGNCCHCGPRLSVITALPYDRANTTLAAFALCPTCAAEYAEPGDRRFHAQPTACPDCGPQWWYARDGERRPHPAPLAAVAQALQCGQIAAIKATGGWQLACLGSDEQAVRRLRARKRRPSNPLALMAASVEQLQACLTLDRAAIEALCSPAAPIVLCPRRAGAPIAAAVAPASGELGAMLAHTPLHHLLLRAVGAPLVMTSGNPSGAVQITADEQALSDLRGLADVWLGNDRPVALRVDDSVLRRIDGRLRPLRRARGMAPTALAAPAGFAAAPPLSACGGALKNTFCLLDARGAVPSGHIGDLAVHAVARDLSRHWAHYHALFDHRPRALAVDWHPDCPARAHAAALRIPLIAVQHHHAHLASCLFDNARPLDAPPVLGLLLDGLGLGEGGALWGGELLLGDYRGFERVGGLRAAPLPGGEQAMRQPWRNALARLQQAGLDSDILQALPGLSGRPVAALAAAVERGINCPASSAAARLFEAVAALLELAPIEQSHEGEAAMALEAAAARSGDRGTLPFAVDGASIDPAPALLALLAARRGGAAVADLARRFHLGLAAALASAAGSVCAQRGLDTVALSGGVCQNALLIGELAQRLRVRGLTVLQHQHVPCNDGGLSLGQAAVAAARLIDEQE